MFLLKLPFKWYQKYPEISNGRGCDNLKEEMGEGFLIVIQYPAETSGCKMLKLS